VVFKKFLLPGDAFSRVNDLFVVKDDEEKILLHFNSMVEKSNNSIFESKDNSSQEEFSQNLSRCESSWSLPADFSPSMELIRSDQTSSHNRNKRSLKQKKTRKITWKKLKLSSVGKGCEILQVILAKPF